ncbi:12401_t:CDS:2, partial [Funneliformis geosporum]
GYSLNHSTKLFTTRSNGSSLVSNFGLSNTVGVALIGKVFSIRLAIRDLDFFSTAFQNWASDCSGVSLLFIEFLVNEQSLQGRG